MLVLAAPTAKNPSTATSFSSAMGTATSPTRSCTAFLYWRWVSRLLEMGDCPTSIGGRGAWSMPSSTHAPRAITVAAAIIHLAIPRREYHTSTLLGKRRLLAALFLAGCG